MSRYKVVVTDHLFSSLDEERKVFRQMDTELVEGQCRNEEETLAVSRDADAILNTEEAFGKMKRTAFLINVARGKIIDQAALCQALQQGRIAGAALDVLETEPPKPDDPILMGNVILTPHSAWYSEQSKEEMRRRAVGQVVSVLNGELPYSLVNREVPEKLGRSQ